MLGESTMKSKNNFTSCSCAKQLVDVTGLCAPQDITEVISNAPYWMQMYIPETLSIPPQKPDMEEITSLDISVDILRAEVIKTPISYNAQNVVTPNLEGKILTGRKLIIEGQLCQKVEYTAADEVQSIHSAHFYVPFSSYIVVPKEITVTKPNGTTTTTDSLDIHYSVNTCIEDVSICQIDARNILKQVTLLLYAVPTSEC